MPDVDWIRKLCLAFPDATEDEPWPDDLCFKVRGKIFTSMALSDGRFPRLTLKAAPEAFHELLEIEGISTTRELFLEMLRDAPIREGRYTTGYLAEAAPRLPSLGPTA